MKIVKQTTFVCCFVAVAALAMCICCASREYVATAEMRPVWCVHEVTQETARYFQRKYMLWLQELCGEWTNTTFKGQIVTDMLSNAGTVEGDSADEMIAGMSVEANDGAGVLRVRAVAKSAQDAADIANAYAQSIIRHLEDSRQASLCQAVKQTDENVERKRRHLDYLKRKLAEVRSTGGYTEELEVEYQSESDAYRRMKNDAAVMRANLTSVNTRGELEVISRADAGDAVSRIVLFGRWNVFEDHESQTIERIRAESDR